MNEMQTEIAELKEFIADLKADRAATRAKEKRDSWTKYVSLTVVIVAVIAAIANQWGGKYGSRVLSQLNDATFYQTQASDQWAYYQAKGIKLKVCESIRDQLQLSSADPKTAALIKNYDAQITKYQTEQKDVQTKAQDFEAKRDIAHNTASIASAKGGRMGLAISLFSVAVAVASISLVTKTKPLWFMGLLLSGAAIFQMVRAFLS